MHTFYHGGGNRVDAYGGSNHRHRNFISRRHDGYGNFTPKRHKGVGNFSSYDKSYGHTYYDDYGGYVRVNAKYVEHSPYGCYKGSHDSYNFGGHSYGRGVYHERLIDENVYRRENQNEHVVHTKCKENSLMKAKGCEDTPLSKPAQGVEKVEPLTPSIVEGAPKVKELPYSILDIEESLETHVKKEISNEDSCNMNEKSIENEECIETKEKDRCKKDECEKEKEIDFEKSERTKENRCFILNKRVLKKSKKKKGTKWNSLALIFLSDFSSTSWTSMLGRNHTMKNQEQGEVVGKELIQNLENSSMSPFLNPSVLSHELSYEELKLVFASYISHVSIARNACSISFGRGLFLVVPYVSKCLSSHTSLEDR
ncbi:hypothetical protein M9H77_07227 [Catharanthus roseus]|uniref:Uncharacterized protein n=1 Tax=Catharanthus roseus TaxID=4058 RepID=A0ACC0BUL0_CATRO|nr:hypothetical protein M9H77_07227 [Catharanthus roseus]